MSGSTPRGALRGGDLPTVNVDAQTNPKAKTIPTIRYVHRKRIPERLSAARDHILAGKVAGPVRGLVGMVRQGRLRARAGRALRRQAIGRAFSTFARISSMSTVRE